MLQAEWRRNREDRQRSKANFMLRTFHCPTGSRELRPLMQLEISSCTSGVKLARLMTRPSSSSTATAPGITAGPFRTACHADDASQ